MTQPAVPTQHSTAPLALDQALVASSNGSSEQQPGGLAIIPGLFWAFRLYADGDAESLNVDRPIESTHGGWLWLHFNLNDVRGNAWIASAELPAPARTLLLSADNYSQLHATDSCVFGVFADLVRGLGGAGNEIGFLRFAMTEGLLISGRRHPLNAIESVRQAIESGRRLPHVAGLLEMIVEHVALGIERTADGLSDELDEVEEALALNQLTDHRARLGRVRRTSVRIHRQLLGMRTLFHRFEREGIELKTPLQLAASKLAQRLDGLDHDIVEMRDRAYLLQEEISAKLAEETNRQLNLLTIVTTLLLPPTLVTGVFGMNTKGLPLTDVESGFLWAMALIIASSGAVYLLIKRMGILR